MSDRPRRRRRWRRPVALTVGTAVVLVAAGGGVAWALSGRGGDRFTTATVTTGSVQQTVAAAGTVASAARRDVSFPVAGTVASVKVGLGDTVTAGEVLATLDPTSLQSALDDANTTLQEAQQTLSDDLASQTATTSSTSTSSSSSSSSSGGSSSRSSSSSGGSPSSGTSGSSGSSGTAVSPEVTKATQAVQTAQQKLLKAYDAARAALGVSTQALTDAGTACQDVSTLDPSTVVPDGTGSTPAPTDSASPTPTDSAGATPTDSPSATPTDSPTESPTDSPTGASVPVSQVQTMIATCQQALTTASGKQSDTKAAQQAVSDDATALDSAVAALQKALGGGQTGQTGQTGGSHGTTPGTGATSEPTQTPAATGGTGGTEGTGGTDSGSTSQGTGSSDRSGTSSGTGTGTGAGTGTTKVATAADILADRAAVDAAQSQVDIATKDLTLTDLTSPIAGTVGAVSITAGAQVSASSSSAVVTVLGTTGYVVDLTVPLTSLGKLAVGQSATVVVPSTTTQLTGKVSSIGVLDVSSTSTPEYSVVVALDPTDQKLFDGSSAQVSVVVAKTGQVLTVPTSAVHVDGSTATVQVLADGKVSDVKVERGAVGAELTEITSGLTAGQTVVLADRDQPLDTGSTSSSSSSLSRLSGGTTVRQGTGAGFAGAGLTGAGRG